MKLRNKKTGEIDDVSIIHSSNKIKGVVEHEDGVQCLFAYTLKEFNEEWEDAPEEPKKYWFINSCGAVEARTEEEQLAVADMHKQFGNYFETEEEAEKAVEKLKAWKRLKDAGFEFTGWDRHPDYPGDYRITASDEWTCDDKDLDLLLGGEE